MASEESSPTASDAPSETTPVADAQARASERAADHAPPPTTSGLPWGEYLRDRWVWALIGLALVVRVVPMVVYPQYECIRDECIYRGMALAINEGQGLTVSNKGWLSAPGYPYLLSWLRSLFGAMYAVKWLQIVLSIPLLFLGYTIGRVTGGAAKVGRITVALLAFNPTLAWFTNTMWIETVYILCLLAAIAGVLAARRGTWVPAFLAGVALGIAVLFRGVATYLPPFFVLAACYPTRGNPLSLMSWGAEAKLRWRHGAAFLLGTVLTVAPYTIYGSRHHGGFMVTDATVGHVLFLGNNDFPPLTFDYGNGMLTQPLFAAHLRTGRRPCARDVPPVQSSKCEVQATVDWISDNPGEFVGRIPMRLAQLLNPNSFLTRHVRWGYWPGFPWWAKELLAVSIAGLTGMLVVFGTVGAWARARGPYAVMAVGTTLYTLTTIAIMYGMTRFRLPLEALWSVYLAIFLADPRGCFRALSASPWRLAGVLLTIPPLIALMFWYLPTGFPMFW